jgi:hypothetical protein
MGLAQKFKKCIMHASSYKIQSFTTYTYLIQTSLKLHQTISLTSLAASSPSGRKLLQHAPSLLVFLCLEGASGGTHEYISNLAKLV